MYHIIRDFCLAGQLLFFMFVYTICDNAIVMYIFSDGYPDQFGGEKGKKFMIKRMKELILSIQPENMVRQKEIIEKTLNDWIGSGEQIDDLLVIGIRV